MRAFALICVFLIYTLPLLGANTSQLPGINSGIQTFDYDAALATSQGALGNRVGGYSFIDASGNAVGIESFHGKPLVISMVYTSCFQICPMTTRHLAKVVEKARATLGNDSFAVAVIGFDTAVDTPQAMLYFANTQGIGDKGWHLLSADQASVNALSRDIGFLFTPSSNGFDHLIQATILDAEGKVYRQVYGQVFSTPQMIDPLMELVLGQAPAKASFLSNLGDKIKLFCTTYDPVRDGYFFDYSLFIGMFIGAAIIIFTGFTMVREYRKG
ncbi:MAG: SCO family protein [Gammaproteobacteria bacterium]|nr:SCO family protein [Gammaproteobacteria bacterium]